MSKTTKRKNKILKRKRAIEKNRIKELLEKKFNLKHGCLGRKKV